MNLQNLQEIFDHYIGFFPESNGPAHMEYYKWQIIHRFRPMMDDALSATDDELPAKLYAVKKLTKNVIDNFTQPLNGLVEFSKREPATVRAMLSELYQASEMDVSQKQTAIQRFLDKSHQLREKYFTDSYLYNDDLHSVTGYLFLYDPDHNYLYKATHCRKFADCIEFYDDWGSGESVKLDVFFRMCDETLEKIKGNDALIATANGRYEIDPEHMHPDMEKHILLFDIIYCCSTYNLFDGIHYVEPKSSERQLIQAKKDKATELKRALDDALKLSSEFDKVKNFLIEKLTVGKTVNHRIFGVGSITEINGSRFTVNFDQAGVKELGINISFANGLITMEGLVLQKEQKELLSKESQIRNTVLLNQKAVAPYLEYLD